MTRARWELYLFSCQDHASRFADKSRFALPEEIVDKDDIFSFLQDDLCGRTFRSREKGTVAEIKGAGKAAVVTVGATDTGDSKKFMLVNTMEKGHLVL